MRFFNTAGPVNGSKLRKAWVNKVVVP
jgi:hypothetical protein